MLELGCSCLLIQSIYVCLSGLWLGGLLYLSVFLKPVCYTPVFLCIYLYCAMGDFNFKPVCYAPVYTLYLYCAMGDFSYVKAYFLFAAKGVVVH